MALSSQPSSSWLQFSNHFLQWPAYPSPECASCAEVCSPSLQPLHALHPTRLWIHWHVRGWHPCSFPAFVLSVNTFKDCHLSFESLGRSSPLNRLHYVQPQCAPLLYPSKIASHLAFKSLAIIKDDSASDGSDVLTWHYPQPKCVSIKRPPSPVSVLDNPSTRLSSKTLDLVLAQLRSLTEAVSSLLPNFSQDAPAPVPISPAVQPPSQESCASPVLPSTMTRDEIIKLLRSSISTPLQHGQRLRYQNPLVYQGTSPCNGLP